MKLAMCLKKKRIIRQNGVCKNYKGAGLVGNCSQCRHSLYFYKNYSKIRLAYKWKNGYKGGEETMKKELKYRIIRYYNNGFKRETGIRFSSKKEANNYCNSQPVAPMKGWIDGWDVIS